VDTFCSERSSLIGSFKISLPWTQNELRSTSGARLLTPVCDAITRLFDLRTHCLVIRGVLKPRFGGSRLFTFLPTILE